MREYKAKKKKKTFWTFFPVDCGGFCIFFFVLGVFVMYTDDLKGYTGGDRCSPLGRLLYTVRRGVEGGPRLGKGGKAEWSGVGGGRGVLRKGLPKN